MYSAVDYMKELTKVGKIPFEDLNFSLFELIENFDSIKLRENKYVTIK